MNDKPGQNTTSVNPVVQGTFWGNIPSRWNAWVYTISREALKCIYE